MIEIDGSYGSGGGQILRTATALSALTGIAVSIGNIRAGKPNPGLQAQHLTSLNVLARICNAKLKGAKPKSTSVSFIPGKVADTSLSVNIGTAGSITLLLQNILPAALLAEIKLRVIGGTDVSWSPSFNYMQQVLFPQLQKMGARFEASLIKHGYYPKGQGTISFASKPANLPLKPITLTSEFKPNLIRLYSHSAGIPREVSLNQASAASKAIAGELIERLEVEQHISSLPESETQGSGIDLIATGNGCAIGANALGAKGRPAMHVGNEAASALLKEIATAKPVDSHLADQLIPFMALADGTSKISCAALTEHALTNIFVTEKILGVRFLVKGELGKSAEISVDGTGFSPAHGQNQTHGQSPAQG